MSKRIGIIAVIIFLWLIAFPILFAFNDQGFNPSLDWNAVSLEDLNRFRWDLISQMGSYPDALHRIYLPI